MSSPQRYCRRQLLPLLLLTAAPLLHAAGDAVAPQSSSVEESLDAQPDVENATAAAHAFTPASAGETITLHVSDAVREAAVLMRPAGATLEQVIAAMMRLNPDQFAGRQLQLLAFTRPLHIPSAEQIRSEAPDGLELMRLQLDIIAAAAAPLPGFYSVESSMPGIDKPQPPPAAAVPQSSSMPTPAAVTPGQRISIGAAASAAGIAVLLLTVVTIVLRRCGVISSSTARPLSTSSGDSVRQEPSFAGKAAALASPGQAQRLQSFSLPAEYLYYDATEALLQRLVLEFPGESRHVLQLMAFYQSHQLSSGLLSLHDNLEQSGFYQHQPQVRAIIEQEAAQMGLDLGGQRLDGQADFDSKIQQLQQRIKRAEEAREAAERRARKAERVASVAERKLKVVQLQLDFGEAEHHP
jgi:hypothetical protein